MFVHLSVIGERLNLSYGKKLLGNVRRVRNGSILKINKLDADSFGHEGVTIQRDLQLFLVGKSDVKFESRSPICLQISGVLLTTMLLKGIQRQNYYCARLLAL